MLTSDRLAALTASAGYGTGDPLVVAVRTGGEPAVVLSRGRTATGEPLTVGTVVYTASVSKQITAAGAALLVREGRLDVESALTDWMPELGAWAAPVRVRHLIHHTAGLAEEVEFDELHRAGLDRTTARVVQALDRLDARPGSRFRYSNAGYVCLAVVVERAAGRPLPEFARERVFRPLGMTGSRYWSGPAPYPPGAAPTEVPYPAPLSLGDGGVWSTATDLLRWNDALDRDELGVSALLHTPGHLDDGSALEYGWGVDVVTHAGVPVHRHGGLWAGLSIQLVRLPDRHAGFVVVALDHDEHRTTRLADALVDELVARQ